MKIMHFCKYCQKWQNSEDMTDQHVIAESNGGYIIKPICDHCHRELNSGIDKAISCLARNKEIHRTISVGKSEYTIQLGSLACNSTMYFIKEPIYSDNDLKNKFLEIKARPKDFNQGEYRVLVNQSGTSLRLEQGSQGGWCYVIAVIEQDFVT